MTHEMINNRPPALGYVATVALDIFCVPLALPSEQLTVKRCHSSVATTCSPPLLFLVLHKKILTFGVHKENDVKNTVGPVSIGSTTTVEKHVGCCLH